MNREKNLREELGKLDELTCPDYLYVAWRILFQKYNPPDRRQVLKQARLDLQEEENIRLQASFNRNRRQMEGIELRKYNW